MVALPVTVRVLVVAEVEVDRLDEGLETCCRRGDDGTMVELLDGRESVVLVVEPLASKRRRLLLMPGWSSSRERFELLLLPVAERRRETAEKLAELAFVDTEPMLPGLECTISANKGARAAT